MNQLVLELEGGESKAPPSLLTPKLQERLVALMADAIQAVLDEVPEQPEKGEKTDDDE